MTVGLGENKVKIVLKTNINVMEVLQINNYVLILLVIHIRILFFTILL